MKVIWSDTARRHWQETADYILYNEGFRCMEKFMQNTMTWQNILERMPQVGAYEPLPSHLKHGYRSIVIHKLNKLIYYIKGDTVRIVDFWNTRQDSQTLIDQLL